MRTAGTPGRPRKQTDDPAEAERLRKGREWKAKHQERQRELYAPLLEEFFSRPCTDCGGTFPRPAMHPDHVRGEKKHKVAWFTYGNGSLQLLKDELAKCDVRCANCHFIRHAIEDGRWRP